MSAAGTASQARLGHPLERLAGGWRHPRRTATWPRGPCSKTRNWQARLAPVVVSKSHPSGATGMAGQLRLASSLPPSQNTTCLVGFVQYARQACGCSSTSNDTWGESSRLTFDDALSLNGSVARPHRRRHPSAALPPGGPRVPADRSDVPATCEPATCESATCEPGTCEPWPRLAAGLASVVRPDDLVVEERGTRRYRRLLPPTRTRRGSSPGPATVPSTSTTTAAPPVRSSWWRASCWSGSSIACDRRSPVRTDRGRADRPSCGPGGCGPVDHSPSSRHGSTACGTLVRRTPSRCTSTPRPSPP